MQPNEYLGHHVLLIHRLLLHRPTDLLFFKQ